MEDEVRDQLIPEASASQPSGGNLEFCSVEDIRAPFFCFEHEVHYPPVMEMCIYHH